MDKELTDLVSTWVLFVEKCFFLDTDWSTTATVLGPNHSPTAFPNFTPSWAMECTENGAASESANCLRICKKDNTHA